MYNVYAIVKGKELCSPTLYQLTNEPHSGNETERRTIMLQNIEHYGLKLRCNVLGDGIFLFSAVCDQLVRLKITRKRHNVLRKEVVEFMAHNPYTVS